MTKTMLGIAVTTAAVATGAIKGYQLLGKRYGHLLPQKEQYLIPEGTQPVMVHTSIGDFRLVAAGGYYGRTGIFVYAENLVDPDAFMHQQRATYAFPGLAEPKVPQVTPELTAAFFEATDGQFHLDLPPHSSSGGDGSAFALITAGINHPAYLKHLGQNPLWMFYNNTHEDGPTNEDLDQQFAQLPSYSGYFKNSDAPTMRMAAHTLRVIIDGSPTDRIKSDLSFIAEGSLPVHTLRDLRKARTTTTELAHYYKKLALGGYQTLQARAKEFRSKN